MKAEDKIWPHTIFSCLCKPDVIPSIFKQKTNQCHLFKSTSRPIFYFIPLTSRINFYCFSNKKGRWNTPNPLEGYKLQAVQLKVGVSSHNCISLPGSHLCTGHGDSPGTAVDIEPCSQTCPRTTAAFHHSSHI